MAVTELDKGNQFLQEGKLEEAIAAYRLAIELNPDCSWSYHNLGEALAKVGQFQEAIAAFSRAIELKPDFSWSYHHLGDALDRQQQWEEAVVAFRRAIELNPAHFGSYYGLGQGLVNLGQLDDAIAAFRHASELEPGADWIQYRLGEVLQQRTQLDLEGAIVSYRQVIELNPDDVEAYRKLLEIQPDNFEVWLQLGKTLVKLEQWEEAIASYRRITELNPDDVQAHYRLGELLIKHGDLDGAIDTLRHALELSPNSDESYYNLGEALAARGNTTEASLCYYKAFKLNPNMKANQKRPRIYDCFAFFNELDVLRIRIEELKDVVDKFILVEATKTFSGNPKPLYYQEFSHEFAEYHDKIIHYVVDDMPEIDYSQPVHLQAWPLDVHQKNCISRVLNSIDCKDEDIILVNDCDEIPRKEKLIEAIELLKDHEFVIFVQDLYHGHLDNLYSEWWCGTVACKYKDFKVRTYTKVRYSDKINTGLDMGDPAYKRSGYINSNQYFEHPYIVKGGWSFSWFGSDLSRRYKLQSFAHKEGDDSQARGIEKIKYDVCRPSLEMEASGEFYFDVRDIDGKDVPEFLRNNILKYRHFLQPRQTALMAKIGGDFKQADIHLDILKKEISQVKHQLEKSIQNLLKVCETLAERGNMVEAIAQWRKLVDIYPEFTSKKCFLSNLDGIENWRINPEDFTLISGQLMQTQAGQQLVCQTENYGQLCYGPYISLPYGLYRLKIDLDNSDYSLSQDDSNSGKVWFKFDVAVNKGLVIYEEKVYNEHQNNHEFFIDFINDRDAQDLEIRFWGEGLLFKVNSIELTLIYQPGADYYFSLGKSLQAKGQQKQALSAYARAGELDPANYLAKAIANWQEPEAFRELVVSLIDRGLEKQVIACYDRLLESDSYLAVKAHHNLAIVLAKKGLTTEASAILQKASKKQLCEGEIYETIWRGLNQLGILNEDSQDFPTEITSEATYKHFSERSHYQVINLWSLTDSDRGFLEQEGLSLANLELVGKDDIELEEIYINSFDVSSPIQLSRTGGKHLREDKSPHDAKKGRYFQQSIVETGYVYAICPFSGRILRSNQSFICHHPHPEINLGSHSIFIYRFVGVEVFYLVCAVAPVGDKSFIYLPSRELVITFVPRHTCHASEERIINILKSKMVSCWQLVKSYISHDQKKDVVTVIGYMNNIAHFIWNELSGIQYLHESGNLQKIEKFLIGYFEYLNLGATYPEIDGEKIINLPEPETLFETILVNKSVAVWPTDAIVKEDLANRIYQGAVKQCSPKLLQEIEKAKNHSPLIWMGIRCHYRVWLSQVEGIASIINSLLADFPNLGIVFDGWGKPERDDKRADEEIVKVKEILAQIRTLIPSQVEIYNLNESSNYEKSVWAKAVDFYIAPEGAGLTFPIWVNNKPGIIYGVDATRWNAVTTTWSSSVRENALAPVILPVDYVDDKNSGFANYDVNWRKIYYSAFKRLSKKLKNSPSQESQGIFKKVIDDHQLERDIEFYKQKPYIRKIEKIEVKDVLDNYGSFIYAEWNHPNEISRDWSSQSLYYLKTARWDEYIKPGTIAIDIGAHSGDTTLPMSLLTGSEGMVLAFEPNPHVFQVLEVNQYLNRECMNIKSFDVAIMEQEGLYEFTYGDSACCNGGYDQFGWNATNQNAANIQVKGVNLVAFLESQFGHDYEDILKKLSLIKLDCEGHDKEILKTLKPITDIAKPVLFVEWFAFFNQEQTDDLFHTIQNLGYSCYNPVTLELLEADNSKKIPDILCLPNQSSEIPRSDIFIAVSNQRDMYGKIGYPVNVRVSSTEKSTPHILEKKNLESTIEPMLADMKQVKSEDEKISVWQQINAELAKVNNLELAIIQWRKALEIIPDLNKESTFLDRLSAINTIIINPEQLILFQAEIIATSTGRQLICRAGNYGMVSFGPYINLHDGLYKVKINLNFENTSVNQYHENREVGLEFDVASQKGFVIYRDDIDIHQQSYQFYIELLNAKDLEIRFYAKGIAFSVNLIEIIWLYQPEETTDGANYYIYLGKSLQRQEQIKSSFLAYLKAAELNSKYLLEAISVYKKISISPQTETEIYARFCLLVTSNIKSMDELPDGWWHQVDWWQIGDFFSSNGFFNEAIQLYHQAFLKEPNIALAYKKQAESLTMQNKLDEQTDWKNKFFMAFIKEEPDYFNIYVYLARFLLSRDKWDEAVYAYKKALKLTNNNTDIVQEISFNLNYALAQKSEPEIAIDLLKKCLDISPNDEWNGKVYAQMGECFLLLNLIHRAIEYYEKSLLISANNFVACLGFAKCLIKQDKLDEAEYYLKHIVGYRDRTTYQEAITILKYIADIKNNIKIPKVQIDYQIEGISLFLKGSYYTTKEWAISFKSNQFVQYLDLEPREIKEFPNSYGFWSKQDLPNNFVATLPKGRYLQFGERNAPTFLTTIDFYVVTFENKVLLDASQGNLKNNIHLCNVYAPPVYYVEGTVAVISGFSVMNYYHWMIDHLPKYGLMEKAGIDFTKVDKIVVTEYSSFHKETLDILGVTPSKIIDTLDGYSHIGADRLIVTPPNANFRRSSINFLRNRLMSSISKFTSEQPQRIYISRRLASKRKFINENEVIEVLEKLGFVIIDAELLSVAEQISLFAGAKVVIGIHGAGLTNLVFCNSGTKVIELFLGNMNIPTCYHYYWMCCYLDLEYYFMIAEVYLNSAQLVKLLDIDEAILNIDSLKDILKSAGVT